MNHFINKLMLGIMSSFIGVLGLVFIISQLSTKTYPKPKEEKLNHQTVWFPSEIEQVDLDLFRYGHELITQTSYYLGPQGKIAQISNGLNCQNCHLNGGTKAFGNNYGLVSSTYPKYRARSGKEESIEKRINDCFERSLNGKALDVNSKEMKAIKTYIVALGKNVNTKDLPKGLFMKDNQVKFLTREASIEKGRGVYEQKCQSCHQSNGQGMLSDSKKEYIYPPLWGKNSYNDAAGLYRLTNFAKFIKYNMPLGTDFKHFELSDEDVWDVAAFVNSQPRPHLEAKKDWPKLSEKPIDFPFEPYADQFSEKQHKYGPFQPIQKFYSAQGK